MVLSNIELEALFHRGIRVVRHEVVAPTVPGRISYTIPLGGWFIDRPADTSLEIDSGSGWVPQAYGADYGHLRRYSPPPTVADLCIGWTLSGPPGAWLMRFRWNEWVYQSAPQVVTPVRLIGGPGTDIDYSVIWYQPTDYVCPDAVWVPPMDGFGLEFWRRTNRTGGLRGSSLTRSGKRYVPYIRFAPGKWIVHNMEFRPGSSVRIWKFKVCYYDPVTGARSPLSNATITANQGSPEMLRTVGVSRGPGSVWVDA